MSKGVFQDSVGNANVTVNEGLPTEKRVRDIANDLIASNKSISIQTVLAEVKGVIYNEKDLENVGLENPFYIGAIKASPLVPFNIMPENGKGWILPVNSAVRDYPVIGELVSIINLGAQTFYHGPINVSNSVNQNMKVGISSNPTDGTIKYNQLEAYLKSKEGGFSVNPFPRPVKQFAGDWAINGRNDQSIRIGKNEDTEREAVIKIRIAEEEEESDFLYDPLPENIDEDVASMYFIRDGSLSLNTIPTAPNAIETEYIGPLIVLDSDQLLFNSKEGGNISILSGNDNTLVSVKNTNIIGQNVFLGDIEKENIQPAVLGDQLVGYLHEVFQQIISAMNQIQGATGVGNLGMPVPIPGAMAAAAGLSAYLSAQTKDGMKTRLLSKNVKISKRPKKALDAKLGEE